MCEVAYFTQKCVCVCCVRHQRFGSQPWDLSSEVITLFKKSNQKKTFTFFSWAPCWLSFLHTDQCLGFSPAWPGCVSHTHTHTSCNQCANTFLHRHSYINSDTGSSGMLTFACTHTHFYHCLVSLKASACKVDPQQNKLWCHRPRVLAQRWQK